MDSNGREIRDSEQGDGVESFGGCEKWAGKKEGVGRSGSAADVVAEPRR
jgi:hypothetical protein